MNTSARMIKNRILRRFFDNGVVGAGGGGKGYCGEREEAVTCIFGFGGKVGGGGVMEVRGK